MTRDLGTVDKNGFVAAFQEAIASHNAMTGLSAAEPPSVHLFHILASALEYADYHKLDFDLTVEEVREHFVSQGA